MRASSMSRRVSASLTLSSLIYISCYKNTIAKYGLIVKPIQDSSMTCTLVAFSTFWIGVYLGARVATWYHKEMK